MAGRQLPLPLSLGEPVDVFQAVLTATPTPALRSALAAAVLQRAAAAGPRMLDALLSSPEAATRRAAQTLLWAALAASAPGEAAASHAVRALLQLLPRAQAQWPKSEEYVRLLATLAQLASGAGDAARRRTDLCAALLAPEHGLLLVALERCHVDSVRTLSGVGGGTPLATWSANLDLVCWVRPKTAHSPHYLPFFPS